MALIAMAVWSVFQARVKAIKINGVLAFPVLLYLLMCLSIVWSADGGATSKGLVRELPLLVLPLIFWLRPQYTRHQANAILRFFTAAVVVSGCFYIGKAIFRYLATHDANVFYYHELAGDNAIYVSAIFSLALFFLASIQQKKVGHYVALIFLMGCLILLSSKMIVVIDILILSGYFFITAKMKLQTRLILILAAISGMLVLGYYSRIKDRIIQEYVSNTSQAPVYINEGGASGYVYDVSMREAWQKPVFSQGDRFTGTSFRVYQARIFTEMLKEDNIFWKGFGLGASQDAIARKDKEHNLFCGTAAMSGYQTMNFHNQYLQAFAELGVFGLLILLALLLINLKCAVKQKYFVHIAFAILMIALFLTESFLWRQRGVVFFTLLYCLFNTIAAKEKTTV